MPCPKTIALIKNGRVSFFDDDNFKDESLSSLLCTNMDAFCKEVTGESGRGAFSLCIWEGDMIINGVLSDVKDLANNIGSANYIIQERLNNHPDVAKIYPNSLNTLKLITLLQDNSEVEFFDGVMRFGAGGSFCG